MFLRLQMPSKKVTALQGSLLSTDQLSRLSNVQMVAKTFGTSSDVPVFRSACTLCQASGMEISL